MTRRNARPFVALVAAYALALQALLAGVVLGARSGEAALLASGGLCLTGEPQGDRAPADRMPCCSLAACCPAAADAAAVPPSAPVLWFSDSPAIGIDCANTAVLRIALQDPHQPRAPPAG
jgi:hypothetical protein